MSEENRAQGHIYTVQLRFSGDQLDPSAISAILKVAPSSSSGHPQGQLITRRKRPHWAYNGLGGSGFQPDWAKLEEGLEFLLNAVSPKKSEILRLAREFDAYWWCGHFQSSFNGGPTLSSKLLAEIGSYDIPLRIDNYFSEH